MKVLILGVSGLIGHTLFQSFSDDFDLIGTVSKSRKYYGEYNLFHNKNILNEIDALNFSQIKSIIKDIKPNVVLNCIGITKRKIKSDNLNDVIYLNSLFPHLLAKYCLQKKVRVVHFSTDCVFDGKIGNYDENSETNSTDFYGKTKSLGEIKYDNSITIRSSFIGHELFDKTELFEWVLSNEGMTIKGFKNCLYSGVSTNFMTQITRKIITDFPKLNGVYQLATDYPLSKCVLISIKYIINK